jgi:hypothetical protein
MKKFLPVISIFFLIGLLSSCSSGHKRYHDEKLPSPHSFNAHFPDMDHNGDDLVQWEEFDEFFPNAEKNVFNAIDLNKDGVLDHDEWHAFKEAHGLKHKSGGRHNKD